ncbi:guanylate kinase [Sulfuriroseicoccus oceanibius]|uniref:Guanylate kinase n=1 Tax=Sulfuriroseicoccus oceanibius TaxID=2707525 RepID=A0A6B3LAN8_9BACT|nr:guanylate kinase [Sulfuriroseicoccus oceanibius]QQL45564.1 guanylate kinase [Sulfuriroseicoccus oceanibius]
MTESAKTIARTERIGLLCMVSGPTASGKTTVCRKARDHDDCVYSISCTTRAPREGEVDGVDYHFLDKDDFIQRTAQGDFLEWATVHGNYYGTLKSEVVAHLEAGRDVVMDIDIQGAQLIRATEDPFIRNALVDVFILPPSMDEIKNRLFGRGTETDDQMRLRLYNALDEMKHWREYRYAIVSDTPEADFDRFRTILNGERMRACRMRTPAGLVGNIPTDLPQELITAE